MSFLDLLGIEYIRQRREQQSKLEERRIESLKRIERRKQDFVPEDVSTTPSGHIYCGRCLEWKLSAEFSEEKSRAKAVCDSCHDLSYCNRCLKWKPSAEFHTIREDGIDKEICRSCHGLSGNKNRDIPSFWSFRQTETRPARELEEGDLIVRYKKLYRVTGIDRHGPMGMMEISMRLVRGKEHPYGPWPYPTQCSGSKEWEVLPR